MPELPDLEIFSYNLDKELSGRAVQKVTVSANAKHKNSLKEFDEGLTGRRLLKVRRFGKQLFFDFEDEIILSMHLMLFGELHLAAGTSTLRNTIFEVLFDDNRSLVLTDFQLSALAALNQPVKAAPDALSEEINFEFLKKTLKTRKAIKTLLMDQNIIQGIGNAYADEILWHAGISPFSLSNKIPDEKIKDLESAMKSVLRNAIEQIRETHPTIISGEVRDFLIIHNPHKNHSPNGAPIKIGKVNSRKTYFTDEQELFK